MVQLKITTALTEDYSVQQPLVLPRPKPTDAFLAKDFPLEKLPQAPNKGYCLYPQLSAVVDDNGLVQIVYDTVYADPPNCNIAYLYQDPVTLEWKQEQAPAPPAPLVASSFCFQTRAKIFKDNAGGIHIVTESSNTTRTEYFLSYLDLTDRFPHWIQIKVPISYEKQWQIFLSALDAYFDLNNQLVVVCCVLELLGTRTAQSYKWLPRGDGSLVQVPELQLKSPQAGFTQAPANLRHGYYQDSFVRPELQAVEGFYFDLHGLAIAATEALPCRSSSTKGPPSWGQTVITTSPAISKYVQSDWWFLDDRSTAPMGFLTYDSKAYFICNSYYGQGLESNLREIFQDIKEAGFPPRDVVQVTGLAIFPQGSDASGPADIIVIHAFAVVERIID